MSSSSAAFADAAVCAAARGSSWVAGVSVDASTTPICAARRQSPRVGRPRATAAPPAQAQPRTKTRGRSPGTPTFDVAVAGAGPAGLSLAAALAERGARVAVVDPRLHTPWPNHYGVWRDEFEELGLEHCATTLYPTTAVCVGGSNEKTVVQRPYIRVDRVALKDTLLKRCAQHGVLVASASVQHVDHVDSAFSTVTLSPAAAGVSEGSELPPHEISARLVVDCTGHALRFTKAAAPSQYVKPMEQAAYGIEAEVVSHPYQVDEMLLMDFRDDHMRSNAEDAGSSAARPTFLYVFPTSGTRAFFEETSVIAPEAVSFEELKERLYKRLRHDGVVVTKVIEEEFSLIPMGGTVPDRSQRIVSFGGAACLVHPATGYMVARTMRLAGDVANVIVENLRRAEGADSRVDLVSHAVWDYLWSRSARRQRDFLNFGAQVLCELGVGASRGFFDTFFRLPDDLWRPFLSARLDDARTRVYFALYFFAIATPEIRLALLGAIFTIGRWNLIRSVLPVGLPAGDD